jgi:two-component system, NarL family, nitrate/nitrite response regulator NarL
MSGTRSVVVADDHPAYLAALSAAIKAEPSLDLVGAAEDGCAALELIERTRPDVAVLDVEMPRLTGPVVAARVAQLELATRVLFLSASRDGVTVYDALTAGGYGYITKDAPMAEVRQAVLRVASGGRRFGLDQLEHQIIDEIQQRDADRPTLDLTERELAVLQLAVKGMTVMAIGKHMHLSPATVEVHLATLYAKLDAPDRPAAVAEAIRRGLVG